MKRIVLSFAILLSALSLCTSCLKSDDDKGVTYSDDTAVTSFVLGNVNQYVHTLSKSGADSVYKKVLVGSNYKFYIDQLKHEIYNADSLPVGCDAKHLLCTIASKNSGTVLIMNIDNDSLKYVSETDSLDFSVPRTLRVVSNSGNKYRDYTVRVNVKQQEGEPVVWQQMVRNNERLAQASRLHMASLGSRVFAFGLEADGQTFMMDVLRASAGTSTANDSYVTARFEGDVTGKIASDGKKLFVVEGNKLHIFESAESGALTHNTLTERNNEGVVCLVGACNNNILAISTDGNLIASDDYGLTWTAEMTDNDTRLLPTEDISSLTITSRTNTDVLQLLLVGNRNVTAYPTDETAQVWCKKVDAADVLSPWYAINQTESTCPLPRLQSLSAALCGDLIVAVGGKGIGGCNVDAFSKIFVSEDGGINWKSNSNFVLPAGFVSNNVFAMTADNAGQLWMVCGESGQIWCGKQGGFTQTQN